MSRKIGPSGVHYEARVLNSPGSPETSDWVALLDQCEMNSPIITGDSFEECMEAAREAVENQGVDTTRVVIARIETTYITPTSADFTPESMQLHRVPEGRRFRVEDEPDVVYTRVEMIDVDRNHFNAVSNTGQFFRLDSLQHVVLLPDA